MTFYTILCLTNTKVIRKHAKEIIAELTIRTIEDWTPKNRIALAVDSGIRSASIPRPDARDGAAGLLVRVEELIPRQRAVGCCWQRWGTL